MNWVSEIYQKRGRAVQTTMSSGSCEEIPIREATFLAIRAKRTLATPNSTLTSTTFSITVKLQIVNLIYAELVRCFSVG